MTALSLSNSRNRFLRWGKPLRPLPPPAAGRDTSARDAVVRRAVRGTFRRMDSAHYHPFPNTHWSLVRRAGGGDAATRREALATLLARYEPALLSYVLFVRRMPPDEARELVQGFIADKLLEQELLRSADEKRGRFRTLLLTSLNHFAASRARRERVRAVEPIDDVPLTDDQAGAPHAAVDAAWARALVRNVLAVMREQCAKTDRADIWAVFEGRVLAEIFGNVPTISYDELARRANLSSPTQAANLLVTAKRMYARLLRAAVAEYELDDGGVDAEIAELRAMLAHPDADDGALE